MGLQGTSSDALDLAFLRSDQQDYISTPTPAGWTRLAAAAAAAGDKVSKLHRFKGAQVTASVSVGRDYDKIFEMIASLDRKIQAIWEIVESRVLPGGKILRLHWQPPPPR